MTKDEALDNLARAYFAEKLEWKLFMHSSHADIEQRCKHIRANEKWETMRSAYLDCNVIEWDDIEGAWWFGIKLERTID